MVERGDIDVRVDLEQRLVCLQLVEIVSPQAGEDYKPAVGEALGERRGKTPGLLGGGAGVEFLALVHVEENARRRLALALVHLLLGGTDQIG